VVAVTPDCTAAAERAVDRPRDADGEAPHAAAERSRIVRLDDEVEMVVLDREMENPEAAVGGRGEGAADGWEDPVGSEAVDGPATEGHMHGVRSDVQRPRAMRNTGTTARGELATSPGATAAPGAGRREGKLQGTRHLVWAIIAA